MLRFPGASEGPTLITHNLLALGAIPSAHGGRAPVSLSLPWWPLAVILCPRCPCMQHLSPWSGGTCSPPSAVGPRCPGRGCSPTAARPGATGALPLPRAVPQGLGPLACGRRSQAGVRGHWYKDRGGDSWCPCATSMALTRVTRVPALGMPQCATPWPLPQCSCWGRSARSQGWHCPSIWWF